MQIMATFESFEEMWDFAAKVVKVKEGQVADKTPVAQVASVKTPLVSQPAVHMAADNSQTPTTPSVSVSSVPTTAPAYILDDLAKAAMTIMDSGHQGDLVGLLAQFGVEALPALPKEHYGAFATALRGLGAQI